ncbi:MAG TPA: exosortase/archaeosortase family protein [Candidatus Udaeobacter sp.]|jgi:exosortase C (VPDSG-CTERM-specific)|nr:exosortase/archaeosortase family protein [Candidatus Udaeobacter sp.]
MTKPPDLSDAAVMGMQPKSSSRRFFGFFGYLVVLTLCFCWPLSSLFSYALHSDLHSHIVLIPFITAYLLYVHRDQLPEPRGSSPVWSIIPFACAAIVLAHAFANKNFEPAAIALCFICLVVAGGFIFLGSNWMRAAMFPFGFLFFMIPLPDSVANYLENASKLASAECANFFLHLTGTPVLRDGTIFQLPNIAIEVAQECSGIRSSWVLLIAGTLASYLFLRKNSNRLILVLATIPLGFLRNGFRIAVIGLLCINLGPRMIHSPIHRQGGPLFFVLSLFPLLLLLWLLRRREHSSSLVESKPDAE